MRNQEQEPAGYIAITAGQKLHIVIREAIRIAKRHGETVRVDRQLGPVRIAVGPQTLAAWREKNKPKAKTVATPAESAPPPPPDEVDNPEAAVKKTAKKAVKKAVKKTAKKAAKKAAKRTAAPGGVTETGGEDA